jgi:transcriptional regulator with XRE-family HTH domain
VQWRPRPEHQTPPGGKEAGRPVRLERFAQVTRWNLGIDLSAAAIGEQLRTARTLSGLSQVEAAAGIFQPKYLSLVELGKKRCSIAKVRELARRVDCDLGPILSLPPGGRHLPPPGNRTNTVRPGEGATPLLEVDGVALGAHLRAHRTAQRLSLADVAGGDAGLDVAYLRRIERGLELPSIQRFAEALELDLG